MKKHCFAVKKWSKKKDDTKYNIGKDTIEKNELVNINVNKQNETDVHDHEIMVREVDKFV